MGNRISAIHSWFIDAIAIEIADHGQIATLAEFKNFVGSIDLAIVVGIDNPFAIAEHADLIDAIAIEIANNRNIPLSGMARRTAMDRNAWEQMPEAPRDQAQAGWSKLV